MVFTGLQDSVEVPELTLWGYLGTVFQSAPREVSRTRPCTHTLLLEGSVSMYLISETFRMLTLFDPEILLLNDPGEITPGQSKNLKTECGGAHL